MKITDENEHLIDDKFWTKIDDDYYFFKLEELKWLDNAMLNKIAEATILELDNYETKLLHACIEILRERGE